MHRLIVWVLILHTLHAPVLMPDTDGECRGTPIESLIESQAWHPVLLGVRPNDDIDRGPIRSGDEQDEAPFDGSQFGELAIVRHQVVDWSVVTHLLAVVAWDAVLPDQAPVVFDCPPTIKPLAGRLVCVNFCVWRI